jgi:hypothetical protein
VLARKVSGLLTKVVGLTWSAVGVVHEAAGWRDAVRRAIARDNPATHTAVPGILVAHG